MNPVTFEPVIVFGTLDGDQEPASHEAFWTGKKWLSIRSEDDESPKKKISNVTGWIPMPAQGQSLPVPDVAGFWWWLGDGKNRWELVEARDIHEGHLCLYSAEREWGGYSIEQAQERLKGQWIPVARPPDKEQGASLAIESEPTPGSHPDSSDLSSVSLMTPMQFAKVDFRRGGCISPGKARHPWTWSIVIQKDHVSHMSNSSFGTLAECVDDFQKNGIAMVSGTELQLAAAYAEQNKDPYDVSVVNPSTPSC